MASRDVVPGRLAHRLPPQTCQRRALRRASPGVQR